MSRPKNKKSQVISKSGKVLHVELGFTYSAGRLRPFVSDCKAYLRNPYLQADHRGVKVSLQLETVLILLL